MQTKPRFLFFRRLILCMCGLLLCTHTHTLVLFLMQCLAHSQPRSLTVPKELVFRFLMNDREQVPCLERMSEYYDLAGWLPLSSHALEFSNSYNLHTACCVAPSMKHCCNPSSQSDHGHWNLSVFGSTDEPAQAVAWFPVTRDYEDKTGSTFCKCAFPKSHPLRGIMHWRNMYKRRHRSSAWLCLTS